MTRNVRVRALAGRDRRAAQETVACESAASGNAGGGR
jgi:hypothetical protein